MDDFNDIQKEMDADSDAVMFYYRDTARDRDDKSALLLGKCVTTAASIPPSSFGSNYIHTYRTSVRRMNEFTPNDVGGFSS